ncbi:hypothetical protein [Zoogloea sp.]|uniref:hypothetical protein n=1 Tax=Zoogloea sp. TaxID=49181 RepID=UPI0035B18809
MRFAPVRFERCFTRIVAPLISTAVLGLSSLTAQAGQVLFYQDFENPTGFRNDGQDVNIYKGVNQLYGSQFAQTHTVETLYLKGTSAFGHGYSDPSGKGGGYAIGMQHNYEDDWLGMAFSVGSNAYLNVKVDISSIDVSGFGCPCLPVNGLVPVFRFTLYDNPSGKSGLGDGTILDFKDITGTASPQAVFDWTEAVLPLSAQGSTNGNVILRIDLLSGKYAAFDNLQIAASDVAGDVGRVPEPGAFSLAALGLGMLYRRRWLQGKENG